MSEYIYEDKLRGPSECFTKDYKFAEECHLSEIQQYLPEGHPDKEFVLHEKWCVEITASNVDVLSKWRGDEDLKHGEIYGYLHSNLLWREDIRESIEITFEQFKKNVLKTKEMEKREIIEYKLKEDCKKYLPALDKISCMFSLSGLKFMQGCSYYEDFKKAGVLDLWFEPIFKEKFKVGDWVMETWASSPYYNLKAFRIIRINDEIATYDRQGECKITLSNLRLATPEEIKKTLVEEAIKRGFTKGIKFKFKEQCYGKSIIEAEVRSLEAEHYKNNGIGWRVISTSSGVVYSDKYGWAEILPNYPQIEINGYKGEFYNTYIKFGCAQIHYQDFVEINNSIKVFGEGTITNKGIESVTIGKVTFSKEQIKLISDYYLNKK